MTRARLIHQPSREFDLVRFTADAEWVLRDESGDVTVWEDGWTPGWSERDIGADVEVKCDFCGRWSTDAAPMTRAEGAPWMCFGGDGTCPEPNPSTIV